MTEPPSTPRHRYLSRDERIAARALRQAGHTYTFIANQLSCTERQVAYAITRDCVTPKKRSGRPPRLSDAQVDQLEAFIRSSNSNRQLSYLQLAQGPFQHWNVGEYTIRSALRRRGYALRGHKLISTGDHGSGGGSSGATKHG
ncbi:uncharacterized protein CC84DRAFT_1168678 [Paraphaeosphaeria sporulosa]|uniref:Transposase IS30-like HTH domain-containing protein n=1 Tax=Paraphaeosphaeria sporulosa TaxID=1460663 RepID=A0A177C1J8_9PLEO|nr:uncharacterized protein CC84DRAFT_1168678 [Paraphaeosphaeria sporulosa]OAG00597.1 hypothetical protein CC84DRAFT_1168678 [Paraphaeosphaeria sporulosa]